MRAPARPAVRRLTVSSPARASSPGRRRRCRGPHVRGVRLLGACTLRLRRRAGQGHVRVQQWLHWERRQVRCSG